MQCLFSPTIDGIKINIEFSTVPVQKAVLFREWPHRHNFIEFHYIFDGEETVAFQESGQQYTLTSGKLVVIPARKYHSTSCRDNAPVTRTNFSFSIESDEKKESQIFKLFSSLEDTKVIENTFVSSSMSRLRSLLNENNPDDTQKTRAGVILLDLIFDILYRMSSKKASETKQLINRKRQKDIIDEYISTQCNAAKGLKGLADELCLSERQTRKLVSKFYGEDYKTLIIRERMTSAELLLKTTDIPLEEIALRIGYNSYSGFHLAFIRTHSETPGEYRKRIK